MYVYIYTVYVKLENDPPPKKKQTYLLSVVLQVNI